MLATVQKDSSWHRYFLLCLKKKMLKNVINNKTNHCRRQKQKVWGIVSLAAGNPKSVLDGVTAPLGGRRHLRP